MTDNARKVVGDLAMMDAINNGEDVTGPGRSLTSAGSGSASP